MREWLKNARKEKGITMAAFSKELGISESYYSLIESGARQEKMDMAIASKISKILNISLKQIVNFEQQNKTG